METTKLSSKGQVVIPGSLRKSHHWESGQELVVIDVGDGILLKSAAVFEETQINDVASCLKYTGDGWIYLGNKNTGLIVNTPANISIKTVIYKLKKATNLRTGKPEKSNGYKLQSFVRTLKEGSEVKILELDIDKNGHFWVQVDEL